MTTAVTLQVHGLNLRDQSTFAALERLENASFAAVDGLTLMTVYVKDQAVVPTVTEVARQLTHLVPGADVVRVHPDLVSASEIAQRVGVSREAVRKWTVNARNPFPRQLDTVAPDMRVWRWMDVVTWLLRVKGIDMDEDLPTSEEVAHIDACLARVPDATSVEWQQLRSGAFQGSIRSAHARYLRVLLVRTPATLEMATTDRRSSVDAH